MAVSPQLYNAVFERLVKDGEDIEGFIAYGLYKQAKREWLMKYHALHRKRPSPAELTAYNAYWTDTSLQSLRESAESALSAYAETVIDVATPSIEAETLKSGRPIWKDLAIGASSALTYSLLLIVASYLIRVFGNDFADAFQNLGGK